MIYFCTDKNGYTNWEFMKSEGIVFISPAEAYFKLKKEMELGLDIETTVEDGPDDLIDRRITLIQFGIHSVNGLEYNDQVIFDIPRLQEEDLEYIFSILSDNTKKFIIHFATFEYPQIQTEWGIKLENIDDTYLLSKILNSGLELPPGYHSLKGCLNRMYDIPISKDEQTSFTGCLLSIDQIRYGAIDVLFMHDLRNKLITEIKNRDLLRVYDCIEKEVVKCYGDMMCNPMKFNTNYWKDLAETLTIEANGYKDELNAFIQTDVNLLNYVTELGLIQKSDKVNINWRSTTDVKKVLSMICPEKPEDITKKPDIVKWAKTSTNVDLLKYINRDFTYIEGLISTVHKDKAVNDSLYLKAGKSFINWDSPDQRLAIFRFYYPELEKTNDASLSKLRNPLILKYKQYIKSQKRVTSYGLKFITNNVGRNDLIRPRKLSQILKSGTLMCEY